MITVTAAIYRCHRNDMKLLLLMNLVHVFYESENLAGIAPLIIIEADQLKEMGINLYPFPCIEDGGVGVSDKIRGHDFVIYIIQDAGQICHGGLVDFAADILVGCGALKRYVQIDDGDVRSRNPVRDSVHPILQRRDDQGYCFRCSGGGRNQIAKNCPAGAPILQRPAVDYFLLGGCRVDCGHQAIFDAIIVLQDFADGRQTVRGTRSVRYDLISGE